MESSAPEKKALWRVGIPLKCILALTGSGVSSRATGRTSNLNLRRRAHSAYEFRTHVLHFKTREEWRAWLAKHHASSLGIWFVFYKSHTEQKSISYEDMVQEALCFGWIDSLIKRIDDNRYGIKVTPRQPTSKWSNLNRKRWADLKAVGLLTEAGLAAAPTNKTYGAKPVIPDLPSYIAKAFRKNTKAWEFFQELAPTHRRYFVVWIHMAKRPETREKRIRESIRLLAARKKLGLK